MGCSPWGIGAGVDSIATGLGLVWIGYSLIFGIANGFGYGFRLQFAAHPNPENRGLAMAVITAAYAFGAVISPYGFELELSVGGFFLTLITLGLTVYLVSINKAFLIAHTRHNIVMLKLISAAQACRMAS